MGPQTPVVFSISNIGKQMLNEELNSRCRNSTPSFPNHDGIVLGDFSLLISPICTTRAYIAGKSHQKLWSLPFITAKTSHIKYIFQYSPRSMFWGNMNMYLQLYSYSTLKDVKDMRGLSYSVNVNADNNLGPLLLTWINFDPSMDK